MEAKKGFFSLSLSLDLVKADAKRLTVGDGVSTVLTRVLHIQCNLTIIVRARATAISFGNALNRSTYSYETCVMRTPIC